MNHVFRDNLSTERRISERDIFFKIFHLFSGLPAV
jgi:hypothetical protein